MKTGDGNARSGEVLEEATNGNAGSAEDEDEIPF
jgi:hypothetical protein